MEKRIGIVGLGKMGGNIARRLVAADWEVYGFDKSEEAKEALAGDGVSVHTSILELAGALPLPRLFFIMVPHQFVDEVLADLSRGLNEGDVVIDAGNSNYQETIRRAEKLKRLGVSFIDVGVSGGPMGALLGSCLMVGGSREHFLKLEHLWRDLALDGGYGHFEGVGAGHFVKMVHNGIEYGMMQSIAEGFNLMRESKYELDLKEVSRVYRHGSVIVSRLLGWLEEGYQQHGVDLKNISGTVAQSGEGQWTVEAAKELKQAVPIIEGSLAFRKETEANPSYTGRVLSLMRTMFGGHEVLSNDEGEKE